jgi:peptidoglycan/LPS O-acetylase OafA/YrhL
MHVNLQRTIAILGNGVNLFFVISGFCIWLALRKADWSHPFVSYAQFAFRRWVRLSPAFYAAAIGSALVILLVSGHFPGRALALHIAWLGALQPELAAPFWSLETEWEFYLTVPLLLFAASRFGVARVVAIVGAASIVFRVAVFATMTDVDSPAFGHLPTRFMEFGWGILAASWITSQRRVPWAVSGMRGVLVGAIAAYVGRAMMTTEAARWTAAAAPVIKALAEPTLTLGYAIILMSVVTSPSLVRRALESSPLQAVGRWSYSLYLLHWWPSVLIGRWAQSVFGTTVAAHYVTCALLLVVLLPAAALFFKFLERPFLHGFKLRPLATPGV